VHVIVDVDIIFSVCVFYKYFVEWFIFFYSSRRRNTRSKRDWSSDVCSSDLPFTCPVLKNTRSPGCILLLDTYVPVYCKPLVERGKTVYPACSKAHVVNPEQSNASLGLLLPKLYGVPIWLLAADMTELLFLVGAGFGVGGVFDILFVEFERDALLELVTDCESFD